MSIPRIFNIEYSNLKNLYSTIKNIYESNARLYTIYECLLKDKTLTFYISPNDKATITSSTNHLFDVQIRNSKNIIESDSKYDPNKQETSFVMVDIKDYYTVPYDGYLYSDEYIFFPAGTKIKFNSSPDKVDLKYMGEDTYEFFTGVLDSFHFVSLDYMKTDMITISYASCVKSTIENVDSILQNNYPGTDFKPVI